MTTITDILAAQDPAAPAIGAPGKRALTYSELNTLAASVRQTLNAAGLDRGDRAAIVLPNGPEMASCFLAVSSGMSAAPLNPGYRQEEFQFYLSDLAARTVILAAGVDTPARSAANELGIPVVELESVDDGPAGQFVLTGTEASDSPIEPSSFAPDDEALVLHTSGTTSRPKVVPLSNQNLAESARNIAGTLSLTSKDVGLNIMPLFHIHGLVASLLSSMSVGAQVICTPGFNALSFFQQFSEASPTWYTAVPTMHQAILRRAARNQQIIEKAHLRFVRSSSSSLPPPVMLELESLFRCPVIEAYGMTEAAHQMASNPLPPSDRKPGTVGLAAGPEVRIMSEAGALLPNGQEGEIVIRGANVFSGYENNASANSEAFTNGWFRTGDLGIMDESSYLTISGRLKEIINRGGEKIAPREVDDVIQAHPAVDQVVTFSLPHDMLGEEVAAVIVVKEGEKTDSSEIRAFASERLANFKVPSQILFRDEIPKGATGKLQRIGLADKLGLTK